MKKIRISKIRISNMNGFYYVYNNELLYNDDDVADECSECQVSDLTDLTIYQYNELVKKLWAYYPNYNIEKLEGSFI